MSATFLRLKQRLTDFVPYILGERGKVFFGAADPKHRLERRQRSHHVLCPN
jgi:hypothetical protein